MKYKRTYNIIFAGGSIPPMLGALEAVANGRETFVYIERGRLFNGIDAVDGFTNLGFDTGTTRSIDDEKSFTLVQAKVKELADADSFFNFYINESRALKCAAIAANAGLEKRQFHIYMMEDGIDTYKKLDANYGKITGYQPLKKFFYGLTKREWFSDKAASVLAGKLAPLCRKDTSWLKRKFDRSAWYSFVKEVKAAEKLFDEIMSKTDNRYSDSCVKPDYRRAFPLACLDGFTYLLQSIGKVHSILERTRNPYLLSAFRAEGYSAKVEYRPDIVSRNIPQKISTLSPQAKQKYLTLMFNAYSRQIHGFFDRTQRAGRPAPDRKLVYVSARFDTMCIRPVTDRKYGIGAMTGLLPEYENLDSKYKSALLFPAQEDYRLLYDSVQRNIAADAPPELVARAQARVFNYYADYVFTAKLIYTLYGEEYDIVIKNHPRCDIGAWQEWSEIYRMKYENGCLEVGRALDEALQAFHSQDSTGRYMALVSGGLSTENFEYLDADVSFCGQPSSVYNGLSDDASIPFIICDTDADITGGSGSHVAYSAVSERYSRGLMKYADSAGKILPSVYYNTGNTLKACRTACKKLGDDENSSMYSRLFAQWLESTHPGAKDTDHTGRPVK